MASTLMVRQDAGVSVSIDEAPGRPPQAALDTRDRGGTFARLIAGYLRRDPECTVRFSDVWWWSEWPGGAGRPDTGIDLVAANRNSDTFTAIQWPPHEYPPHGAFRVSAGAAAAIAPRMRVAAEER